MIQTLIMKLVFSSLLLFADDTVEITARFVKANKNYIYMQSDSHTYKIIKKELPPEGVSQIEKNKDKPLTLFVPAKAIKSKEKHTPKDL